MRRHVLFFHEPPSLNQMIRWRGAKWQAYYGQQQKWLDMARDLLPPLPDDAPWAQWEITRMHFRLHSYRDPLELPASLKWPVDLLEEVGWVLGDNKDQLVWIDPEPTQEIARSERGVRLEIAKR